MDSNSRAAHRLIFVTCALGLLAIRLIHVAILDPHAAHSTDDWNYMTTANYMVETQDWTFPDSGGRPFAPVILGMSHLLFPGRFQMLHHIHQVLDGLIAIGIFYFLWRMMPDKPWFAFILALIYLLYIPKDNQTIVSWLVMGTWGGLFMIYGLVCLLEFYLRGGRRYAHWALVLVGTLFIFIGSWIYEGTFLLMAPIPLVFVARYGWPDRKRMAGLGIWYVGLVVPFALATLAILGIAETALRQSDYQEAYLAKREVDLVELTLRYFEEAFPMEQIVAQTNYTYVLVPLLSVFAFATVTWTLYQLNPAFLALPRRSVLIGWVFFGFGFLFLGAFPYVYGGFAPVGRSLDYAVVGQAMVIIGVASLCAITLKHALSLRVAHSMFTLIAGFLLVSGQWFYDAQAFWGSLPTFADKAIFVDQLTALVPHPEEDTLILLHPCVLQTPYMPWYSTAELKLSPFLYGEPANSGIQLDILGNRPFQENGISVGTSDGRLPYRAFYGYDQMIVIGCDQFDLYIMPKFPSDEFGVGEAIASYNPYARIVDWQRASQVSHIANQRGR